MEFKEMGLSPEILIAIKKIGITKPTHIQEISIPYILEGEDVVGESATGSGKTLAFAAGIIEHVKPREGLQALVLTPTRELAEQVKNSISQLSHGKRLRMTSIYGGVAINPQMRDLANVEIVVGTPGRLLDHMQRRTINLSKIKVLVMDEADRMFDMGFIDDVEKIIGVCPKERQTLFFSATLSERMKQLAKKHMVNPMTVLSNNQVDPSKLKQVYYDIEKRIKLSLLVHLLDSEKSRLVMVFCNTRHTVDFIVKNLKSNSVDAIAIHGGLTQNKRTKTIELFNKGKKGVLVCTDVAARGLHIDNVSHIYNYEIPRDPTDYIHRIGRTARAGEDGKVINLICDLDYENFSKVKYEHNTLIIDKVEAPQVKRIVAVKGDDSRRDFRGGPGRSYNRGSRGKSNFRGRR